ncbi:hypothetical protein Angca_009775 [Angiostrongylus cantonensis]|nr:hypothetical protein Angca_009775 [Angiostrongylus cantonensis]
MAMAIALLLLLLTLCHVKSYNTPQTYSTLQCRVNDPLSCDQTKHEVCIFSNGRYQCECPTGIKRLPDGRCLSVDECARPSLNSCHQDARCIDMEVGYTCECKPGFADVSTDRVYKPGRICKKTNNECGQRQTYGVDCDPNAACVDTPEGFQCVCQPGFVDISSSVSRLPGRKCVEVVNECSSGMADCSSNADCFDRAEGYECKCRPGFVDASPDVTHYPGRVCNRPRSPEHYGQISRQPQCRDSQHCGPNEECRYNTSGETVCQCMRGAVQQPDGKCKLFSQCEHMNECDRNALCSNAYDGLKCKCKAGFIDISPDPYRFPGRKCKEVRNECADGSADCSPFADCVDLQQGYLCKCKIGYTDVSSRYQLRPGRKCSQGANQCSDRMLNSCDQNADCVQLPDGYTCKCFTGYVDVSSNANLSPGRVCTLNTVCPVQATDLVFLVDGSGSIGSYIFQTEVLRFLTEFSELFDIAPDKTRVSVVQYSDQIRHEFGLNDYSDRRSVQDAIKKIDYLTGLTRTGAAIEHVVNEAFSEKRGARPLSDRIARIGIVITDGRSQDGVTMAAENARRRNVQLFAVGVTNHVLQTELEEITGSKDRTFHVNAFEDLNTRLRSAIQRVTCPETEGTKHPTGGPCDPTSHAGCDRALNQVCMPKNGHYGCGCPKGFDQHPITKVCGGDVCNPEIATSCPDPEICEKTPFGNWRCTCPEDLGWRDVHTGICRIGTPPVSESSDECNLLRGNTCGPNAKCVKGPGGQFVCQCSAGYIRNPNSDNCQAPGTCDPSVAGSCDARKKEKCLRNTNGEYTCQCDTSRFYKRHPITEICLIDECSAGTHDCDVNARCTDTDESFICTCNSGYLDKSPDQTTKPGRVCTQFHNECQENRHNCSVNAECVDLADGFMCRCKEGYVDVSPNMQVFSGLVCRALVDECASKTSNTCHEHAICIDTRDAYKCQCKEGYVDHDELRNPGRDCRKKNQICDSGRHDCDINAQCIERGTNDYECVCKAGYLDRSPLPHRTGRKCLERVCVDDSKHNCHAAAVCEEVDGPEKYTCKCRDGYVDVNKQNPVEIVGRECRELVNECLDPSLNDCDPAATCRDTADSYECQCPVGSRDISKDPSKPGRSCFGLVNECLMPHLNNCSRFADCIDKEEGYECKCKPDYHDQQPENPGTRCKFIINECLAENLNDCDKHAICVDTIDGYECKCQEPYVDQLADAPGRVCRYNECKNPEMNDCDPNADCIDTDDGFVCQCKTGFFDENTDPFKTGRVCIALTIDRPQEAERTTLSANEIPCGNTHCKVDLREVCIGGTKCGCRPGESRTNTNEKCIPITEVPIVVRVVDLDDEPLHYSTDFSKPTSPGHVEVVDSFVKGVGEVFHRTDISPRYVTTDVSYITNPKVENSTWNLGLLVSGLVKLSGAEDVDKCKVFQNFAEQVKANGGRIDKLKVADDFTLLDPCRVESQISGTPCGVFFCNEALGEECIAGKLCGCPKGQKRKDPQSPCRSVESFNLPLYVVRDGATPLKFTPDVANPRDEKHKDLVSRFETGVAQSYNETPLHKGFVAAEVNDIEEPSTRNASWVSGLLYNFTSHFVRGSVSEPSAVFTDLINYIAKNNNYEIGKSKLFISPDQANPFSSCYASDCHPNAICTPLGRGYTSICILGYRDLNPAHPGRQCLSYVGVNECEKAELNECSPDARCIDLDYLYKCECIPPYVNAAPDGAVPGSVCNIDYCSDVHFCPVNSTCKNVGDQARCDCNPGFVDLRKSERLSEAGLGDTICLRHIDVDECALGLHNCSAAAICTDLKPGYECRCPDGYTDGNPVEPGRICAALLCGLCNGHGDCIHDSVTNNVTCSCVDGYSGEFCEVAPSNVGLILMVILALLFLLLTLLCCLYLCARCRCFGRRGVSEGSASGREILGSDYYTIPRAKLKPGYADEMMGHDNAATLGAYLDDGASVSSGGSLEEVERRVTTDVTTREIRTTTVRDEMGNIVSRSQVVSHGPMETDTEQYAITSSDHFRQAADAGASSLGGNHGRTNAVYESDSEASDVGNATYDRVTRVAQSHDFLPGTDPRTGSERRRSEVVTTTTAKEVNYF